MAPNCSVGMCEHRVKAWGMCETHYHRIRRSMMHDGVWRGRHSMGTQVACECEHPHWETCGPLFPTVRQCRWCGSPHPDEFGKPLTPLLLVPAKPSNNGSDVAW